MSRSRVLALSVLAVLVLAAAAVAAEEPEGLKTRDAMTSYAVGVETARSLQKLGSKVDPEMVAQGMRDVASGQKLLMTEEDIDGVLTDFRGEVLFRARAQRQSLAAENQKAGAEFLEANKGKEGVVALQSGLQFKVLAPGTGKPATDANVVTCHFRCALIDGTVVEDTHKTGEPAQIQLSDLRVIPAFREALKLMPKGARWQLFVPSRLAYLSAGRPPLIGPNAVLVFDLEVLDIK